MEPKWEMNWFKLCSLTRELTHQPLKDGFHEAFSCFFIYLFYLFFLLISEVFGKCLWEMYIIAFAVAIQLLKAWFKCTFAEDEIWIRIKDKWLLCRGCVPLKSIRKESGLVVEGVQKHVPCEQIDMGFQCSRKSSYCPPTPEKLTLMRVFLLQTSYMLAVSLMYHVPNLLTNWLS